MVVVVVVVDLGGAMVVVVTGGLFERGGAVVVVVAGGLLVRTVKVAGAGVAGAPPPPVAVPRVVPRPCPEEEGEGVEEASCEPAGELGELGGVVGAVPAPDRPESGVVVGVGTWPVGAGGACWALRVGVEAGPVKSSPRTTDRLAASTLTEAMARLRRRCVPGVAASAAARPTAAAAAGRGFPKSGDSKTSSR